MDLPSANEGHIGDTVILNKCYSYWNNDHNIISRKLVKYEIVGFYHSLYEIDKNTYFSKDKLINNKFIDIGYNYIALNIITYNNKRQNHKRPISGTHRLIKNDDYSLYLANMFSIVHSNSYI